MIKIIIFLVVSLNCFGDVRVRVTNNVTGRKYQAEFETQLEANTWKSEQLNTKSWGKSIGDLTISEIDTSEEMTLKRNGLLACKALRTKLRNKENLNIAELNTFLRCIH